MNKFVERAKELKARLSLLGFDSGEYAELKAVIENHCGDSLRDDELFALSLDTRILLSEFNCPPLYEEACLNPKDPDRLIYLLEKMIEVAEFRQR